MKRALLLVFCALMSVQMFSQNDLPNELFPTRVVPNSGGLATNSL